MFIAEAEIFGIIIEFYLLQLSSQSIATYASIGYVTITHNCNLGKYN